MNLELQSPLERKAIIAVFKFVRSLYGERNDTAFCVC